jgi:hypothetical protein
MSDEPTHYQRPRSRGNVRIFVICYADRFYEDVPKEVRDKGPWNGNHRGDVVMLKPELRLVLAEAGYVVINCPEAVFQPEA